MSSQRTGTVDKPPIRSADSDGRRRFDPRTLLPTLFGVDLRSLALFRIGLGLVVLGDLAVRADDLQAFYTDAGVLPRRPFLQELMPGAWHPSLHLLGGSAAYEAVLFGIAAVFAVALVVGFQTRAVTFVSWLLLVSLHHRNPIILQGGDVLLRMLLFWGIFLPLGARFSMDAVRVRGTPAPTQTQVFSIATAGLLLQICFVYWFSSLLKTSPIWRTEGTAVFYALSIDQIATPLGQMLLPYHGVLKALTFGTLFWEACGPVLAFSTWRTSLVRTLVVPAFWAFHIGLGLCMELGIFPYVCVVAWTVFLPAWFWDVPLRRIAGMPRAARWGASLQQAGAPVHRLLTRRRAHVTLPVSTTLGQVGQIAAAFCLAYIFLWNLRTVDFNRVARFFPIGVNVLGDATQIGQHWGMFAPFPLTEDGWYIFSAERVDGQMVDLFRNGAPLRWKKPARIVSMYKNDRWRKYLMNLWDRGNAGYRVHLARYLCQEWNQGHTGGEQVRFVEIIYMRENTLPGYRLDKPRPVSLWRYQCF